MFLQLKCSFPLSGGCLPKGCLPGGMPASGVPAWGACLGVSARGCLPGGVCPGGCLPGGVCLWGVPAWGCLPMGGACLGGTMWPIPSCIWCYLYASSSPTETDHQCSCLYSVWSCDLWCMLGYHHPPMDRMTDTC